MDLRAVVMKEYSKNGASTLDCWKGVLLFSKDTVDVSYNPSLLG